MEQNETVTITLMRYNQMKESIDNLGTELSELRGAIHNRGLRISHGEGHPFLRKEKYFFELLTEEEFNAKYPEPKPDGLSQ